MIATEAQVRAINLPPHIVPTDSFQPLAHRDILDEVDAALGRAGIGIDRSATGPGRTFTVIDDGAKVFCVMPTTAMIDDTTRMQIGLANSFNKTLAARIGFGSHVMVCSNGCFFAEKVLGRKHTPNILRDLPVLIDQALGHFEAYRDHQRRFFERLRDVRLSDQRVHDVVVRAARKPFEAITGGEIISVVDEYNEPSCVAFQGDKTAWGLHNAFTEVYKRIAGRNGISHSERAVRLSRMFAESFTPDLALAVSSN
jgi:hypothetical protein